MNFHYKEFCIKNFMSSKEGKNRFLFHAQERARTIHSASKKGRGVQGFIRFFRATMTKRTETDEFASRCIINALG